MITDSDRKFLANLEKTAQKEARAKARAEAALNPLPETSVPDGSNVPRNADLESEEEIDEISLMIQ